MLESQYQEMNRVLPKQDSEILNLTPLKHGRSKNALDVYDRIQEAKLNEDELYDNSDYD